MSECSEDRYTVKIVFRGLFVASVEQTRIDVLLPDASMPSRVLTGEPDPLRTLMSALQPFREHRAALEFHLADWDNHSSLLPRLVHLQKPTKGPVALYFLDREKVIFGGLYNEMEKPRPPVELKEDRECYTPIGDDLLLLRQHPKHGFDQLPGFHSDLRPAAEDKCAATVKLSFGEVYTERRSLKGSEERAWRSVSVVSYLDDESRARLQLMEPSASLEPRFLNLDLVVRFTLSIHNPLHIMCEPLEPGPVARYFILRPSDPRRELTVWVKNRELDSILQDSDLNPDPYPPPAEHGDATDRDHALYMRLAQDPTSLKVPRDNRDEASDSGSGCGGSGRPGGGS